MKISLCMIVRDEEAVLERCLQSVIGVVDEIVIVDTGSIDRTKEIASKFTEHIYDFLWCDDFSAARNFSFSKATGAYLMWMDADDILPKEEGEKLLHLKEELAGEQYDTIMLPYDISFDEAGNPTFSYERERIVRNCPLAKWQGRVHEVIAPFGTIYHGEIHIHHRKLSASHSDRNLRIYEQMLAEGFALNPREQFYYARELYENGRYAEAAEELQAFLEQSEGWLENKLEACRCCAGCYFALNQEKKAMEMLLQSLLLAPPSGEVCCDLGTAFFRKRDWKQAIFWYESALRAEKRLKEGAFVQEDCYGYYPCIQLCVCYDRLGDWESAKRYNHMAGVYKPKDAAFLQNKAYFERLSQKALYASQ